MNNYTVEVNTIHDIADAALVDRLAELVYDLPDLVDPTLALNDDGSVTATFDVAGADPLIASQRAVQQFVEALAAAEPLEKEVAAASARAVDSFAVTHAGDREAVPA